MTTFVTQISLEDFTKLYPNVLDDYYLTNTDAFPLAVAIHEGYPTNGYFGKYIGYNAPVFVAENAKHIYSTRDYWEVVRTEEPNFRYKLPKDETKSIYFVIAGR